MATDGADPTPPVAAGRNRHPAITVMTWIVLGLVPVIWVAEVAGPSWVHLPLRAVWVVAALSTCLVGARSLRRGRASQRTTRPRR